MVKIAGELMHAATFLSRELKPEVSISHARTLAFARSSLLPIVSTGEKNDVKQCNVVSVKTS